MKIYKTGGATRACRRVLAIGLAAVLGACANGVAIGDEWVQAYAGTRLARQEVATIVHGGHHGFPSAVDGVNYSSFRGLQLRGIEILPGEHTVTLECDKMMRSRGPLLATPSIRGRFLAGHSYMASCQDLGKSAAAVVMDVGESRPGLTAPRADDPPPPPPPKPRPCLLVHGSVAMPLDASAEFSKRLLDLGQESTSLLTQELALRHVEVVQEFAKKRESPSDVEQTLQALIASDCTELAQLQAVSGTNESGAFLGYDVSVVHVVKLGAAPGTQSLKAIPDFSRSYRWLAAMAVPPNVSPRDHAEAMANDIVHSGATTGVTDAGGVNARDVETSQAAPVDAKVLAVASKPPPVPKPVDFDVMFLDPRQALRDYELYQVDRSSLRPRDDLTHFTYRQHFMVDGSMTRDGIAIPAVVDCQGQRRSDEVDGQANLQSVRPGSRGDRQIFEVCRRLNPQVRKQASSPFGEAFDVKLESGTRLANGCRYLRGDSTPIEWSGNRLRVAGSIDGTPVPMIIDTGSSQVVVPKSIADGLRLPLFSDQTESAYGAGGLTRISFFHTETMAVGNIGRMHLVPHVDNDSDGREVLIGDAFLLDYDLEINDHEMIFFQPVDCGGESLAYWDTRTRFTAMEAMDDRRRSIVVQVTINGHPMRALVDTGAPMTLLGLNAARMLGIDPVKNGTSTIDVQAVGTHRLTIWLPQQFDQFEIAGEIVRRPMFAIADLFGNARSDMGSAGELNLRNAPDMILGADFLRSHRMLFARSQNRMYLSRTGGTVFQGQPGAEASTQVRAVESQ